jgi:hypothetical protein
MSVFHTLQGLNGLGVEIERILSTNTTYDHMLFIFDFDRTLTNGFASPEPNLEINKRIRGGEVTLRALRELKNRNIPSYIITARSPSKLTLEQLEASMTNCQHELADLFHPIKEDIYKLETSDDGNIIALRGYLYASAYAKASAVRHILSSYPPNTKHVYFFDDYIGNSFDVGLNSGKNITSYWWDTFEEEKLGFIGKIQSYSSDFPYQLELYNALNSYGIKKEEIDLRLNWYLEYEKANGIVKPKSLEKEILPKASKLNLADRMQGLAGIGMKKVM